MSWSEVAASITRAVRPRRGARRVRRRSGRASRESAARAASRRPVTCRARAPARRGVGARVRPARPACVRTAPRRSRPAARAARAVARCSRLSSVASSAACSWSRSRSSIRISCMAASESGAPSVGASLCRCSSRTSRSRASPLACPNVRSARVQLGRPAGVDELPRDPQERAHAAARDAQLVQVLGVDREPCAGVVGDQGAALSQKLRLEPADLGALAARGHPAQVVVAEQRVEQGGDAARNAGRVRPAPRPARRGASVSRQSRSSPRSSSSSVRPCRSSTRSLVS